MIHVYIVTWRLKPGIVELEQTPITRQQLNKHIPAATNKQPPMEERPFLHNNYYNNKGIVKKRLFLLGPTRGYSTRIQGRSNQRPRVEAGSNTPTVVLRVLEGDEKVTQCFRV
jgi:hypothetical protein